MLENNPRSSKGGDRGELECASGAASRVAGGICIRRREAARGSFNLYVNDEDIRYLQKEATEVKEGDNISIVPSIAGGAEKFSFS